jgi:hypothetical protein
MPTAAPPPLTPITSLELALEIALDESKLDSTYEDKLTRILQYSAASRPSDGAICYRPWYAAAKALDEDLDTQALTKADGAEFTGQLRPIRSLYGTQNSIDLSDAALYGVVVPGPFNAYLALGQLDSGGSGVLPVMSIQVG